MGGEDVRDDGRGEDDPADQLDRRYRRALLAVAWLVLLNQVAVQPPLLRIMTDAPAINVAGRQRMLSQRLAKAALALASARHDTARRGRRAELADVLRTWSASHAALRAGAGGRDRSLAAAYDGLEPSFRRIEAAAARIGRGDGLVADEAVEAILADEPEYLERMERIVGLYERGAHARVDRLRWTGYGLAALVLAVLAGVGRLILGPASRLIRLQVAELRQARDALEARVRERTATLERVNLALEAEVTERRRAEQRHRALLEQLGHASRTTVIGEMASGLAHEINQPLGAIANYAEGCLVALESGRPASAEVLDALRKVLATALRAGAIVARIRRFVTRHEPAHERFDPNRVVAEVVEFVRDEAIRRRIALRTALAPDLPYLRGDPIQVQQVLVNLVRNAFESLSASQPESPTVVMETHPAPGGAVSLAVRDNGEGIPEGRLDRIFDAYFSTRDEGMGMGLAISRTIAEAHGGRIEVESDPGVRTAFALILPVDDHDHDGEPGPHPTVED